MHHHTVEIFINFVEIHRYWGYSILFLAMLFEGELFMLTAGILSNLGAFHILDVFFIAFGGVILGDVSWYWMGVFLKNKYPNQKFINFIEQKVRSVLPSIEKNPFKLVFASKFLYGLNHSTILVLGFLKIEFWHFFRVQLKASLIWTIMFLALGYFFGFAALQFSHKLNRFVLVVIGLYALFLLTEALIDRFIEKRLEKNGK